MSENRGAKPSVGGQTEAESTASEAGYEPFDLQDWVGPACLAALLALTFLAFLPVLSAGFVNLLDDRYLLQNPHFRGLGGEQLRWMLTTFHGGHYQPLTWLSYALDYTVWGIGRPERFHLTNLLLHLGGTAVFFFVTRRLLRAAGTVTLAPYDTLAAAVAAAVFAIHPLRVESVAWITERRGVLAGVLFFLSVWAYLRYTDRPAASAGWIVVSVLLYVVSMLAKAAALGMPLVLLVLDVYPLRRIGGAAGWFGPAARRVWAEKSAFLLLALLFAGVAYTAQDDAGAFHSLADYGLTARIDQAVYGLTFYAIKTLHPVDLAPMIEIPQGSVSLGAGFAVRVAALALVTGGLILLRKRWPAGLAVWIVYVVLLAPVLGITQAGAQLVADRYSYLSCTGFAVLAGGALLWVTQLRAREHIAPAVARAVGIAAGVVIASLSILTFAQAGVWQNSVTLWRQGVAISPNSLIAHVNLGDGLLKTGQGEEAEQHYRRALEIEPNDAKAHNGLALVLMSRGDMQTARKHLEQAVAANPEYSFAWSNLGFVVAGFGEFEKAAVAYGRSLYLDPTNVDVRHQLVGILFHMGLNFEAAAVLTDGIRRVPDAMSLVATLAWLRATCPDDAVRNADQALKLAERVCETEGYQDPFSLRTLAAAHAESGRFESAVATAEKAQQMALERGLGELAALLNRELDAYRAGQPWREIPPTTQPVTTTAPSESP
ncbi:MAG: tetratricopeptide repeat protein [Phycisphaerae bacterium]|nr:tetratricopeptide repeat protein [Phycisphaerae bacterium]